MAELVYRGSDLANKDATHDKKQWWDLCVLRIIAPIKPMDPVDTSDPMKIEVLWEEDRPVDVEEDEEEGTNAFHHPAFPRDDCPLIPIEMARKKAAVDQVVRLFGEYDLLVCSVYNREIYFVSLHRLSWQWRVECGLGSHCQGQCQRGHSDQAVERLWVERGPDSRPRGQFVGPAVEEL
jgi:hypothetical protein